MAQVIRTGECFFNIKFDKNGLAAAFDDEDQDDEEYDRKHPPVELDDAAFPVITGSFDSDEGNADKVGYVHDAVKYNAQEGKVAFVTETTAYTEVTTTEVNVLPQTAKEDVSNSVSLAAPEAAPPVPDHTMMGYLWSKVGTDGAASNKHPETFHVQEYSNFTLQEAWEHGNIAQNYSILSGRHRVEYKFLFPTLTCSECCFLHSKTLIKVAENDYLHSNRSSTRWYDGVFISSFAQLAAHHAHLTVLECSSVFGDNYKMPMLLHVTYPKQIL